MTARDDILRLMGEAGAGPNDLRPKTYDGVVDVFESFAALAIAEHLQRTGQYVTNDASREAAIAAAVAEERKACAKLCRELGQEMLRSGKLQAGTVSKRIEHAILERGEP